MRNSLFYILTKLLKENNIKVDLKELAFQIQSHPSYPSLHSLTGVMDHFNIQNVALEVPNDAETLAKLPGAFIAYIKSDKIDNLVFATKYKDKIRLTYDTKSLELLSVNDFLELWTGIFVAVEKDDNVLVSSKDKNNYIKKLIGGLTLTSLVLLIFSFTPPLFIVTHLTLSFIGLAISSVIVKHELGIYSKIADTVCSVKITNISCDDVLNSKAANILGNFKLSDIGVVYFMSMILASILFITNQANFGIIAIITIFAFPFTFYSISYQLFKVKKWCLLCLGVVLILWLQLGSLYYFDFGSLNSSLGLTNILLVSISFLVSIFIWSFLFPRLKKEQESIKIKIEYLRFKKNYSLFNMMLNINESISTKLNSSKEIEFGNSSSSFKMLIITNPLCSHCREVHRLVESIISRWKNDVRIIIRFNVSNRLDSVDTKIAIRLLELFHAEGSTKCLNAMHDIYGKVSLEKWLKKWGDPKDKSHMDELIKEKEWCQANNINFTPEILINGKPYPKEYKRSDLIYFIDDILEEYQNLQESEEHEMVPQH